jgi:hypothetical protein
MKPQQKRIRTFLVVVFSLAGLCLLAPETYAAFQNGDFETGPGTWAEDSSEALFPLVIETNLVSIPPHSGTWGAWLCGATNEVSSISQQFTLLGAPVLTYWRWIDSIIDTCGVHQGEILINGKIIDHFDLCDKTATTGWVRQTLDLKNFTGQFVTLETRGNCNSPDERVSNLFLDSFSLQATGKIQYFLPLIFRETPS